ncbi:MAG: hypothetical protein HY648_14240 [Acidobacteria bacterium]|nr:hypothetical protein [Acidobacteriota bacterium]
MTTGGRSQDLGQEAGKSHQQSSRGKSPPYMFANFGCEQLEYRISISLDKFKLDEFKKAFFESIRSPVEGDADSGDAVGATRDPALTDYHIHFSWHVRKGILRLKLAYFRGPSNPDPKDEGPFAEDFMAWLRQFFAYNQAEAHIHCAFSYPKKDFQTLLPIPMTIPVEARDFSEVEVFGMATHLKTKPLGVEEAVQILLEDKTRIDLSANRSVAFEEFDLDRELGELSSVAKMLVREVKE